MKILLISGFFPPFHIAGSEKRAFGYAYELVNRNHWVQVLCGGEWDKGPLYWNGYQDDIYKGIKIRRIKLNWMRAPDPNTYLYNNPIINKKLAQWLREWNPDIVHIISCYTLSASVIQAIKNSGIPVVLTLVDFWFICPRLSLLHADGSLCEGITTDWECLECMMWDTKALNVSKQFFGEKISKELLTWTSKQTLINRQRGFRGMAINIQDRKKYLINTINLVDHIIAPSSIMKDRYKNAGINKPINVFYSGHDLKWVEQLPVHEKSNTIRIGYIGQISHMKGVHILIEAFNQRCTNQKAQLNIYGNQKKNQLYTDFLRTKISYSENNINFCGEFSPEKLGEVLSNIDILVVPSVWDENNPRVIQEAFASKTPVIASDVGGISEFVKHEVNGLLFERGNIDDLANQLQRITDEPGLLERLREGVPPVKSIEEEVTELDLIYQQLVK